MTPYSLPYSLPQTQSAPEAQNPQVQIQQAPQALKLEQPKQYLAAESTKDIPVHESKDISQEVNLQKFGLADVKGFESYFPSAYEFKSNFQYFNSEDQPGSSYVVPHFAQHYGENFLSQEPAQVTPPSFTIRSFDMDSWENLITEEVWPKETYWHDSLSTIQNYEDDKMIYYSIWLYN